jgi:hypothetical membrane protein
MRNNRLWFGPIAVLLFLVGTWLIGSITPGYSHVRQTVSELGEVGAPGHVAFTALLCVIAACLLIYATAVARSLSELAQPTVPAFFVAAMAVSCAGVGIFSYPRPLHNVFGLSETVGLQAPLFAALASRKDPRTGKVTRFSTLMYVLVLLAIALNLLPLFRPMGIWPYIRPFFGLLQRCLFAAWFAWCAGYALLLIRIRRPAVE